MTIRELRTACGMTQKEFSELLGIPKRNIENWEGGQSQCPEYTRRLIEYFLKNERMFIMKYIIRDTEAGNVIDAFATREEAEQELKK